MWTVTGAADPEVSSLGGLPGEPLNILMASGVPKRREGGVAAIIYNLGSELKKLGHQVTYVFLEDLVAPGTVPQRFLELRFAFRLSQYIQKTKGKFAVVNLHAPAGVAYGLCRKFWSSPAEPPYVMTLHGLEERRVQVMKREAKKGRARNFGWKNRSWHRVYHFPRFRWSIRTADAVHVFCRDVWNILQLDYGVPPDRIAYIPNGVEARFFVTRRYLANVPVRLLYAGTWLDQRGIYYLREALQNLKAELPGMTLTIAGAAVPDDEVLRFFGDDLTPRIVMRPTVAAEKMPELYAEHDALIFPSLMEGLPTVVMEAMASGMSVITTETCGMPDVIETEFNGLLIPPGNSEALTQTIRRVAQSAELRERLGQAAQQSMRRHTWERAARSLQTLFQETIARNARSREED
jgi:glycosyltransferase involved in cell wall biosynthesis